MKKKDVTKEVIKKEVIKQNAGIDVSKDTIDVAISFLNNDISKSIFSTRKFANTLSGFVEMKTWLNAKMLPCLKLNFTMEATGVYYESLAYFLHEQGYMVHVVLPNIAKKYAQSLGLESKTDKIDACTLAQMGLERNLWLWQPASPNLLILKQLTRERDALVCNRTDVSNILHSYRYQGKPNADSIKRSEEHIAFLDNLIKEIEKEIAELINSDEALRIKIQYPLSIPGVGMITAAVIIAETNGFAAFSSIKQLTNYAGLNVKISESGTWKGKSKISKRGNSHIRKALYMPALSKKTNDEGTRLFYNRIKEKKGIGMIAVVAVERKLLGLMFTLWNKEEMFRKVS
jgi:transposase